MSNEMDKNPVYYQRTSLWTASFRADDSERAPSISGLRAAFNERNNIPMDNPRPRGDDDSLNDNYFEHVELELAPMGAPPDQEDIVGYTSRLHSIHRNRVSNNQRNDLERTLEARTGALNGRTSKWGKPRGNMAETIESHAELIVAKMERDSLLMEDSPTSEELRREALRDMPQSLTLKRCVKEKLSKSVSQKSKRKPLGCFKMFKYRMSIAISNFKISMKEVAYTFELWYSTVKLIEGNFGSGVANFFKFLRWIFILNLLTAIISFSFVVIPQITFTVRNQTLIEGFDIEDIFTGEGYLTNTFLYYGFYTNQTVSQSSLAYNMPDAYFFTMVCLFLCYFAVLSISVAFDYRRSFIETEGGLQNVFAQKVFCGWDYNIATEDAARLKSRSIYNDLRELLYDVMYESRKDPCIVVFWTRTMQLTMNILVVLSLAASGYLMWFLMEMSTKEHWSSIYSAIAVNLIMTLLPMVFSWVINHEGYKTPKTKLFLTLARTFVLGFVIIGVLVTFWLRNANMECWETSLGQEIYRLILFDFIFSIIVLPLIDLVSYCFCRLMGEGQLHFDIARHTMQIIYNQTLFWVGFFFSPFLAVIVVVKLLVMWYVRKTIVLNFCRPSSKTWRAAQTTTWFLIMSFLSLLLVMGLLGYIITSTKTTNCGPFRNYDYIYEIVTLGVLQLREDYRVWNILLIVTKPGFIALVLIALCGRVYYVRAQAHAQRGIVAIYREMLVWEARDKEFLLENISQITKGQWKYNLHEGREHDPIISQKGVPRLRGLRGDFIRDPPRFSDASSAAGPSVSSDIDDDTSSYKKNL